MEKEKKKKNSRIFTYIFSILCLVLCICITVEVTQANQQKRPPRILGLSLSYVPTESMEPTIMPGDYVLYSKASFKDVSVGDIIIYRNDSDIYVIHRVIEKNESTLITKGDNNPIADDPISPERVYGKYIMTLGFMSLFSGGISRNVIFLILIIIFLIMIAMQIVSIVVKSKIEKNNTDYEESKKLMLEQLRKEIIEEELEKIRNRNESSDDEK